MLLLLKDLCREVHTFKSAQVLHIRSQFIVVAKGFGYGPRGDKAERARLLRGFEKLWFELMFGGPEGKGRDLVEESDLDFVVSCETIVKERLEEVLDLAIAPWETQEKGLREWFYKRGILEREEVSEAEWRPLESPKDGEVGIAVSSEMSDPLFVPVAEKVLDIPHPPMGVDTSDGSDSEESEQDPAWILI